MNHLGKLGSFCLAGLMAFAAPPVLGQQSQHEQIVEAYGGEYDPDGLGLYVRGIVDRLEPHADLDRPIRQVTVLNTPVVNAFATPEGGVYVTRGIMALANSEDELAGVIGHEIGHVSEAHGQGRQGVSIFAGVVGLALEAAGVGELGMLGYNVGANLGLSGYSRGQERDSDRLGVRYIHRAGYDPYALHDFFQSMRLNEQLGEQLAGSQSFNPRMDFFSSHPNTEGRMEYVYDRAERKGVAPGEVPRTIDEYLNRIDGMLYGDDSNQGFVRGQSFIHPDLRFAYDVPQGYTIQNGTSSVVAFHQDGSNIYFDMAQLGNGQSAYGQSTYGQSSQRKGGLGRYIANTMSQELNTRISNIQEFRLNGVRAASGRGVVNQNNRQRELFVVVYEGDDNNVFRFVMTGPRNNRSFDQRGWIDTMGSFHRLSENEAADLYPLTIDVVHVQRGETVADLGARMAFDDFREERFRTLNGLRRNDTLEEGQRVKIVVN